MNCMSCKSEIPSSLKHSLSKNECPVCGGKIFDEEKMAIIKEIQGTILEEVPIKDDLAHKLALILFSKYNMNVKITQKIVPQYAPAKIVEEKSDGEISQEERDRILEEVAKEKYNMIDGVVDTTKKVKGNADPKLVAELTNVFNDLGNNDTAENILEQERLIRLQTQQQKLNSGSGKVKRSS